MSDLIEALQIFVKYKNLPLFSLNLSAMANLSPSKDPFSSNKVKSTSKMFFFFIEQSLNMSLKSHKCIAYKICPLLKLKFNKTLKISSKSIFLLSNSYKINRISFTIDINLWIAK